MTVVSRVWTEPAPGDDDPGPAAGPLARLLAAIVAFLRRLAGPSADDRADAVLAGRLVSAWREAASGAGAGREVPTVSGPTTVTPRVLDVRLGPPSVLTVRMLPGQTTGDLAAAGPRMAGHLGAGAVRVRAVGRDRAAVTLLDADPLDLPLDLPPAGPGPVLLGRDEAGAAVVADLDDLPHLAVQGRTGSGKSGLLYALVCQAAERAGRRGDVRVAGVDGSGLVLRPVAGRSWAGPCAVGLADPGEVVAVLDALAGDLDDRLAALPADRDAVTISPEHPVLLVILEEWPGVLRGLDAHDRAAGKRARLLAGRLLAEGRKVGMRVVLVAQRADAEIVGGAERGQCGARVTFAVDTPAAVRMLHPAADDALAVEALRSPPGVALADLPGRDTARVRVPWIGGYAPFVARVSAVP